MVQKGVLGEFAIISENTGESPWGRETSHFISGIAGVVLGAPSGDAEGEKLLSEASVGGCFHDTRPWPCPLLSPAGPGPRNRC